MKKQIGHFSLFIILFLSSITQARSESFNNTLHLPSYGTIGYPNEEYVYVRNGNFYDADGNEITFFGVNFNKMDNPYTYPANWNEDDFIKMVEYGINLIRLPLSWKKLEPTLDLWNNNYIEIIDAVISNCTKYKIYVLLDLHIIKEWIPSWIKYEIHIWNSTILDEIEEVWDFLASRYKDNSIVIGYNVPWNEPRIQIKMANNDLVVLNDVIKQSWNEWLEKKFNGNLNLLNDTWFWNPLDPDESSWGNVKLPESVRTDSEAAGKWGFDVRMEEWREFSWCIWSNATKRMIDSIKAIDPNHLMIPTPFKVDPFRHHISPMHNLIFPPKSTHVWMMNAPSFDAWAIPVYPCYDDIGVNDQTRMSSYTTISARQTKAYYPEKPLIICEWGVNRQDLGLEKAKDYFETGLNGFYLGGVEGILIWGWRRFGGQEIWGIIDESLNLMDFAVSVPDFAQAFKSGTHERESKLLIVNSHLMKIGVKQVAQTGEYLTKLHFYDFNIITDLALSENPDILNKYNAVIYASYYTNDEAMQAVINWDRHNSSNYCFWYQTIEFDSRWNSDADFPAYQDLMNNYILKGDIGANDPQTTITDQITIINDWQDFSISDSPYSYYSISLPRRKLVPFSSCNGTIVGKIVRGSGDYASFWVNDDDKTLMFYQSLGGGAQYNSTTCTFSIKLLSSFLKYAGFTDYF